MQGVLDTPATTRAFRPGMRLGRYTVVDRIGIGGMAELYLARADGMGGFEKALALKVIHAHLVSQPAAVKMFLREARLAASLDHPNVVQVLDVGVMDSEHVLVMEYVHGADVGDLMRKMPDGQPLPLGCALRIVLDVCAALDYAHEKCDPQGHKLGLVHRDVSPANVLVGFNGSVKLTDFGIAKIGAHNSTTADGTLKGKFGYMSPEQSMGEAVDGRSDVFALGVLLYEITTGRRAFTGDNAFGIMNRVIAGEYVPPQEIVVDYPPALARIVDRAMAVDPEDRYLSARAMQIDLEAFVASTGLVVDAPALVDFLREAYGDPPYPDVSVVEGTAFALDDGDTWPDTVVTTGHGHRRRSRLMQVAVVGLLASGIGAAAGWYFGADAHGEARASDAAERADPADSARAVEAAASQTHDGAAVIPVPVAVEDAAASATAAEESERAEPGNPTRRPKRTRSKRRRRDRAAQSTDDATRDLDAMFPRSMR